MTHAHARGTGASATARQHMNRQDILNDFSVFFFYFNFLWSLDVPTFPT